MRRNSSRLAPTSSFEARTRASSAWVSGPVPRLFTGPFSTLTFLFVGDCSSKYR